MIHRINTERPYSQYGQLISIFLQDKRMHFRDHTRMIDGCIRSLYNGTLDLREIGSFLMKHYDENEYSESPRDIRNMLSRDVGSFRKIKL